MLVLQNLKLINIKLIQYVDKVFHATYRKFLTAIHHINYHPSQRQNTTRKKRSEEYAVHGHYHSYPGTLTPSEEIFLDKFLITMQEINPSLHQDLSRMKRFGQALYPMERINSCIYASFINDYDRIRRDCLLKTLARTTNLPYSLEGYLWAISSLAVVKLQIR